jgi:rRNA maturation RNase YbeY
LAIRFFLHQIDYKIRVKGKLKARIVKILSDHGKLTGAINIILTSDENLFAINEKFLNRKYYTDIITFDYSVEKTISGELYISLDRIKENADLYKVTQEIELLRVIIHGILHLLGYKDDNKVNQGKMRNMEDMYINDF